MLKYAKSPLASPFSRNFQKPVKWKIIQQSLRLSTARTYIDIFPGNLTTAANLKKHLHFDTSVQANVLNPAMQAAVNSNPDEVLKAYDAIIATITSGAGIACDKPTQAEAKKAYRKLFETDVPETYLQAALFIDLNPDDGIHMSSQSPFNPHHRKRIVAWYKALKRVHVTSDNDYLTRTYANACILIHPPNIGDTHNNGPWTAEDNTRLLDFIQANAERNTILLTIHPDNPLNKPINQWNKRLPDKDKYLFPYSDDKTRAILMPRQLYKLK